MKKFAFEYKQLCDGHWRFFSSSFDDKKKFNLMKFIKIKKQFGEFHLEMLVIIQSYRLVI